MDLVVESHFGCWPVPISYFYINGMPSSWMKWTGHVARMEPYRGAYRLFVGNPERKKTFRTRRRKQDDNIKMNLEDIG